MTVTKPNFPFDVDQFLIFYFPPGEKFLVEFIPTVFSLKDSAPVIFRTHEDVGDRTLIYYQGKDTKFLKSIDSGDAQYLRNILHQFAEVIDIDLLDKLFHKIKKCEECEYPNTWEVLNQFWSYADDKKNPDKAISPRFLRCCNSRSIKICERCRKYD